MTALSTTVNAPRVSSGKQKFRKQPDELVRMKGSLAYSAGEAGVKNFLTGKFRVTDCTVFLTNQRFVATKARQYFPWGPLVWLIRAFFARKILFSVPLTELAAIELDPARRTEMILQTTTGEEFKMTSTTIFNKLPQWRAALSSAVTQSNPGITAQQSESAITFTRA